MKLFTLGKKFPGLLVGASLGLCAISTHAEANVAGLHFIATGGLTYSGDTWTIAKSANGSPLDIRGGGLIQIGGGMLWQSADIPLAIAATVNYHFDNSAATNGHAKFHRIPLETIFYYTGMETLRFGVGMRFVQSPKARADINGRQETINFENTRGGVFEIGYAISPRTWLNIRLASEKYTPTATSNGSSSNVSHVGVNMSYQF